MQQLRSLKLNTLALVILFAFIGTGKAIAQEQHNHAEADDQHVEAHHQEEGFNARDMIMHHIKDAHEWHFFDIPQEDGTSKPVSLPLPVILAHNGQVDIFMSSAFHHGEESVTKGDNTYMLHHGKIYATNEAGDLQFDDQHHPTNEKPLDLSITKNVAAMFLSIILLLAMFGSAAKSYKKTGGVPRGLAGFLEPLVLFVRDEIAKPNIQGEQYKKFVPFLLTVFFFIWINNLLGLIPVLAPNLTGNIAVTMVLALLTFFITQFSAKKPHWKHVFLPPVPWWLYPIMIPVEVIGLFTKPFALMIRLFANITAGHILILSLVSLIFIFESVAMSALSIPFMVFMNTLELLVAVLQAYIFTLLSALFIGMATEEHH